MNPATEKILQVKARALERKAQGLPPVSPHAAFGLILEPRNKIQQRERPVRQPGHVRAAREGEKAITGHPGRGIEMSLGRDE